VNAKAEVVEYLGNEELIHASGAGRDIVAVIDSSYKVRPGDMLELKVSLARNPGLRSRHQLRAPVRTGQPDSPVQGANAPASAGALVFKAIAYCRLPKGS